MTKPRWFPGITAFTVIVGTVVMSGIAVAQGSTSPEKASTKISFKQFKAADIVKSYPFLKSYVELVGDPAEVLPFPSHALMAEVPAAARNLKLLFMYLKAPDYCDNESGCTLLVYADRGKGYETVLSAAMFEPLFLLTNEKGVSITYCVRKGRTKWDLVGPAFKYSGIKKDSDSPELPACAKPLK